MKNNKITELKQKIQQMDQVFIANIDELKKVITDIKTKHDMNVISYFTYSVNISHNIDQENVLIGTYHIRNLGNKSVTNPYICIKLPTNSPFSFFGKFITNKTRNLQGAPGAWERINEEENREEFWLKPVNISSLLPSETIAFVNFQIKWLGTDPYSGTILGFTYCEECKEGKVAINQISMSGTN